jgi:bifunctional non-homologous end joining protein LigD
VDRVGHCTPSSVADAQVAAPEPSISSRETRVVAADALARHARVVTQRRRRRAVDLTSPERLLFPDDGITKADLSAYHSAVADVMVPHLAGRPLMLQRFPEGIAAGGFYQKDAGTGMPAWLRTVQVPKKGGTVEHVVVDNADALLALTNLSTISFHRWTTRADRLDRPDLMVIDLDPSSDDFDHVRRAARWTADLLDDLDLVPYPMTTGSRGVHVVTPLDRSADTDEVARFARDVGAVLAARHVELTTAARKVARKGRLYVDVARNGWAQTAIAPYSARPRTGAPVAAPITWDELDDNDLRPDRWTIATMPERLKRLGDPWAGMPRRGRSLVARRERLSMLLASAVGRR